MTEYVHGKKYRVTVDTVYYDDRYGDPAQFVPDGVSNDGGIEANTKGLVAETIPDRLPTTRGSVIAVDWAGPYPLVAVLGADGHWHDEEGDSMAAYEMISNWTLIHDAGAK